MAECIYQIVKRKAICQNRNYHEHIHISILKLDELISLSYNETRMLVSETFAVVLV